MLVQNKVPKQKDTPSHVPTESPVLLTLMGVNQTRPDKPHKSWLAAELKQVIDESTHEASAARRGSRGLVGQKRSSKANLKPKIQNRHSREGGNPDHVKL